MHEIDRNESEYVPPSDRERTWPVPDVRPEPAVPETPDKKNEVPIDVINGALDILNEEEDEIGGDEVVEKKPTIH